MWAALTVKGNGDEQNDELVAKRDAQGHADKDTVEENTHFQKNTLKTILALQLPY